MPDSTKPCPSAKSMIVLFSIWFARSSRNTFRPFCSSVMSPAWATLATSIASEGLQPPGTRNIRTPSPALPCWVTTSLNFVTAPSVILTIYILLLESLTNSLLLSWKVMHTTPVFNNSQLFFPFMKQDLSIRQPYRLLDFPCFFWRLASAIRGYPAHIARIFFKEIVRCSDRRSWSRDRDLHLAVRMPMIISSASQTLPPSGSGRNCRYRGTSSYACRLHT